MMLYVFFTVSSMTAWHFFMDWPLPRDQFRKFKDDRHDDL